MKLNFTRKQNSYSLETIGDFAKELSFAFTMGREEAKSRLLRTSRCQICK